MNISLPVYSVDESLSGVKLNPSIDLNRGVRDNAWENSLLGPNVSAYIENICRISRPSGFRIGGNLLGDLLELCYRLLQLIRHRHQARVTRIHSIVVVLIGGSRLS